MHMNRRDFVRLSAGTGLAVSAASLLPAAYAAPAVTGPRRVGANAKLNVLCIGVVGSIGAVDRQQVASHPRVNIAGLCDVDSNYLAQAGNQHKDAFRVKDYREAFDKYGDKFDAVVVATPDHTHCAIDTLALSKGKHVYGQKPLVQQLEEVAILRAAVAANPTLSTQMGNQRMAIPGRRAAVHILKSGLLGKVKEIFVNTASGLKGGGGYFNNRDLQPVAPVPANLDWDLWQGGVQPLIEYRPGIAPLKWRALWNYGGGGLGDWGCHLLDVVFYAYPELGSPVKVTAQVGDAPDAWFQARRCKTVLTFKVSTPAFAGQEVKVHYSDEGQAPTREELGLPEGAKAFDPNLTSFVCEGGTLMVSAGGALQVWRGGKQEDWAKLPGMPKFKAFNHWHEWVNTALGQHNPELHWSPFAVGLPITEATLLAVKSTKFPGQELHWDASKLAFTNHDEATRTIVKRDYRKGFEPVRY